MQLFVALSRVTRVHRHWHRAQPLWAGWVSMSPGGTTATRQKCPHRRPVLGGGGFTAPRELGRRREAATFLRYREGLELGVWGLNQVVLGYHCTSKTMPEHPASAATGN